MLLGGPVMPAPREQPAQQDAGWIADWRRASERVTATADERIGNDASRISVLRMVFASEGVVMRPISVESFERPKVVSAGPAPMLQWLNIDQLVVDPSYQRPIIGKGRRNVDRIARAFSWSCFAPVVVSPVEGGKFAIIDGQHRTTAAALVGFDSVPCQIVIAALEQQAAAFKAINGTI